MVSVLKKQLTINVNDLDTINLSPPHCSDFGIIFNFSPNSAPRNPLYDSLVVLWLNPFDGHKIHSQIL